MAFAPLLEISRPITKREADIAVALGEGLSYKEAGAVLGIAESTARHYAEKLADKFDGHITVRQRALGPKFLVIAWVHQLAGRRAALTAEQLMSECDEARARLGRALSEVAKRTTPTRNRRQA